MKFAIITDQHFDCRGGSRYWIEQQRKFYSEIFFPEIDRQGIDTLLILGDTWEYRYKLGVNSMNAAFGMFFDELEKRNIKTFMIYGNHDVAFKNTNSVNSVDFLGKMYPNIEVISKPTVIQLGTLKFGLVPWITVDNREESWDFIKSTDATVLGGHFEINGAEMIPGKYCEDGIEQSALGRFDLVLSGHFHTVSRNGNIFYISNPFWTSWSDYGEKKGFRIMDSETLEIDFIENPFEVYFKIMYDDDFDVINFDYSFYESKMVKVFVSSFHKINQSKFDIFLEGISVVQKLEVNELESVKLAPSIEGSGEIDELSLDNQKMVDLYLDKVAAENGIDHPSLSKLFFDIMEEARSSMESE